MKNRIFTLVLFLVFLAGLSLLLYPTVSDYWNTLHASQAVENYVQEVEDLNAAQYDEMLAAARDYNKTLLGSTSALSDEQEAAYEALLNIDGSGIMGYIEVPTIDLSLPIYHDTRDSVLQIAVGHIKWSSLPVGGESTHCVLSGHRGLPSAKLFTNLDKLVEGDRFVIHVLDETLTYEVDQILIVEPTDLSALTIADGKDLCTLVTCTPYGINTHRLLVRGHRVENEPKAIRVTSDATQVKPLLVAPIIAAPILLVLLIPVFVSGGKKNRRKNTETE